VAHQSGGQSTTGRGELYVCADACVCVGGGGESRWVEYKWLLLQRQWLLFEPPPRDTTIIHFLQDGTMLVHVVGSVQLGGRSSSSSGVGGAAAGGSSGGGDSAMGVPPASSAACSPFAESFTLKRSSTGEYFITNQLARTFL